MPTVELGLAHHLPMAFELGQLLQQSLALLLSLSMICHSSNLQCPLHDVDGLDDFVLVAPLQMLKLNHSSLALLAAICPSLVPFLGQANLRGLLVLIRLVPVQVLSCCTRAMPTKWSYRSVLRSRCCSHRVLPLLLLL